LARESKDVLWAAVVLAADSVVLSRVKERFLTRASFVLSPNQGSRTLPKEANPES